MKNFEKYEKEILAITQENEPVALINGEPEKCSEYSCDECGFRNSPFSCSIKRTEWLYKEYMKKPELNKFEKNFCEALQKGWLARDSDGELRLYEYEPNKSKTFWCGIGFYTGCLLMAQKLNPELKFEFISWEDAEPWSVRELLQLPVNS